MNGEYIYILNGLVECLYLGSSSNKYRHRINISGNSHLKISPKEWYEKGLDNLMYVNIGHLVNNSTERLFVEKLLIDKLNPSLNSFDKKINNISIDDDRKWELKYLVDFNLIEFKTLKINKSELQRGNVAGAVNNTNLDE